MIRVATLALLMWSFPASAREWPSAGGWDIAETADACGMTSEYQGKGETVLIVLLRVDGTVIAGVGNSLWSIGEKDEFEPKFELNGFTYSGGKAFGTRISYKPGFMAGLPRDFLDNLAAGKSLHIYKDGTLIDQLSLAGTAAGVAMMRRCVASVKARVDAENREKARFAHIPDDPFAKPPTREAARPRANFASYVSVADYPESAVRAKESGTVSFKLEIGPNGRVSDCTVTSSSGSSALDTATCRIMRQRAKFTPARDPNGNPTNDTTEGKVTWTLPAE